MTIEGADGGLESISAVTLATQSMAKSVEFYRSLGFELASGGPQAEFTTFRVGGQYLNIIATSDEPSWGTGHLLGFGRRPNVPTSTRGRTTRCLNIGPSAVSKVASATTGVRPNVVRMPGKSSPFRLWS